MDRSSESTTPKSYDRRDRNRDGKISPSETLYDYVHHPRLRERVADTPVRVADQLPQNSAFARFNSMLGLKITLAVGTMSCAYLFALLAFVSLPGSLNTGSPIVIVSWVAQTFLQLVLLPVIIVGQNLQAAAADKRGQQTFEDASAALHEAREIQKHLIAQDSAISAVTSITKELHQRLTSEGEQT